MFRKIRKREEMIAITENDRTLEIHPITEEELKDVLAVYRACEDFLALGPVATASMEMVLKDMEISKEQGGLFCGIVDGQGRMIGVVDFVPNHYQGDPHLAELSLLMIASGDRSQGTGKAVVQAIEREIGRDPQVTAILSGVQVNNPQAIRFWKRMGYRITSGPRHHPDQTTAFDLRKDLAGSWKTTQPALKSS
jgi:ribosomal protein S18 acetylase RimI-like enzyme